MNIEEHLKMQNDMEHGEYTLINNSVEYIKGPIGFLMMCFLLSANDHQVIDKPCLLHSLDLYLSLAKSVQY